MNQIKPVLLFFHGLPGSPRDAELLSAEVLEKYDVKAVDFLAAIETDGFEGVYQLFDQDLGENSNGGIHVAGFSLGSMVAVHVAAARPNLVTKLTLISPAAPLELGDFLPDMAGKPLFALAKASPRLLGVVTYLQALLVQIAPKFLIRQLFAKAGAREQALLSDPEFQYIVECGMKHSFLGYPKAYRSILQAYVARWSDVVRHLTCEIEIWHGADDTWSPADMPQALCSVLQDAPELHILPKTEHYSTLTLAQL